jgi:hypothetical protein
MQGSPMGGLSDPFVDEPVSKTLVRYEKLDRTYKGLLMFACAFIALRKAGVI